MPSKPNYLQRSLLQILSHWELGLQCMNLGDTDIQSMKQPTLQDESWSPSCHRFSGKLRLQYSEGLTLAWDSGGLMNVFGFTLSYFVTGSSCLPPGFPKIGWLCAICRSLQLSQSTILWCLGFCNFNQVCLAHQGGVDGRQIWPTSPWLHFHVFSQPSRCSLLCPGALSVLGWRIQGR